MINMEQIKTELIQWLKVKDIQLVYSTNNEKPISFTYKLKMNPIDIGVTFTKLDIEIISSITKREWDSIVIKNKSTNQ